MAKRKNKVSKSEELFEQIINDPAVRQSVTRNSLEHFLPVYFNQYMEYES